MNILITGCNGFLGTNFTKYFGDKSNVIAADRTILDPRDLNQVIKFFDNNKIDVVLHTAIKGGRKGNFENINTFFDNIKMFDNLSSQREKFKIMFNFGSGAEFDRRKDISEFSEERVFEQTPVDYYGLSKNLITRKIIDINSSIFNLRLFGCFGTTEEKQRLFKNTINKIKISQSPEILQDKYMDYFFIEDVCTVVEHIINNHKNIEYKDFNLCYDQKNKLSDHIKKIQEFMNNKTNIKFLQKDLGMSYTGNSSRLNSLKLNLNGLEIGIKNMIGGI